MSKEAALSDLQPLDVPDERAFKRQPGTGLMQRSEHVAVELVPRGTLGPIHEQVEIKLPVVSVMIAFQSQSVWEALGTPRLNKRRFQNRFHFMPAETELFVRPEAANPEMLLFRINPEFASSVLDELFDGKSLEPRPVIGDAHARLLALGNIARTGLLGRRQQKSLEIESLATLILAEWSDVVDLAPPDGLSQKMVAKIKDFVEEHLDQDLALADLAAVTNLSPTYFLRSFKQATGQTPHRYVMERRVLRARQRIEATDLPLADIAYDCGFSSQSHMTDVFKSHMNTSPGRYRRLIRT